MVKLIVDYCGDKIGTEVAFFKECILLIENYCTLEPEIKNIYKVGTDLDVALVSGNHYFYVSDEFQRGLLIGRIIFQFPSVIILSSRPEALGRYLGKFSENIRYLSKDTVFIQKNEEITLKGPNTPLLPFNNPDQITKKVPKDLNFSSQPSKSLIINKFQNPEEKEQFSALIEETPALSINSNQGDQSKTGPFSASLQKNQEFYPIHYDFNQSKSTFPVIKPNIEEKFEVPVINDNCYIIQKYLEDLVIQAFDHNDFNHIKNLGDLFNIFQKIIREIAEKNSDIIDCDFTRRRLMSLAAEKVLNTGFFSIPRGKKIEDIISKLEMHTELVWVR